MISFYTLWKAFTLIVAHEHVENNDVFDWVSRVLFTYRYVQLFQEKRIIGIYVCRDTFTIPITSMHFPSRGTFCVKRFIHTIEEWIFWYLWVLKQGWWTFDVKSLDLHFDGIVRIVQHPVEKVRFYFRDLYDFFCKNWHNFL